MRKTERAEFELTLKKARTGSIEILQKLIDYFAHVEWLARKKASDKIIEFYKEKAVDYLISAITSDEVDVRFWALITLSNLPVAPDKLSSIEKVMQYDEDDIIKIVAGYTLAKKGKESGKETVISYFNSKNFKLRRIAKHFYKKLGKGGYKKLIDYLNTNNDSLFASVSSLLQNIPVYDKEYLTSKFNSLNNRARTLVASILHKSISPATLVFLIKLTADKCWLVRRAAYESAVKIILSGGHSSLPAIYKLIKGKNPDQRYWAIRILCSTYPHSKNYILQLFKEPEHSVRKFAAIYCSETQAEEFIKELLNLLNDANYYVREAASNSLIKYKEKIVSYLNEFDFKNDEASYWLMKALAKAGKLGAQFLISMLGHESVEQRILATIGLEELNDESTIPSLIKHLNDKEWIVRYYAASAIEAMKEKALPELLKNFGSGIENIAFWCKKILSSSLNLYKPYIIKILKDHDESNLVYCLHVVLEFEIKEALPILPEYLTHSNPWVRQFAIKALKIMDKNKLIVILKDANEIVKKEIKEALNET